MVHIAWSVSYITLHHVLYITLHHITVHHVRYITLHHITSHYVLLHCVMLCYVMLPYVTLRYTTLRYVWRYLWAWPVGPACHRCARRHQGSGSLYRLSCNIKSISADHTFGLHAQLLPFIQHISHHTSEDTSNTKHFTKHWSILTERSLCVSHHLTWRQPNQANLTCLLLCCLDVKWWLTQVPGNDLLVRVDCSMGASLLAAELLASCQTIC